MKMKYLYKDLLFASLEYGQGYDKMIGGTKEEKTKNYDYSSTLNEKVLDYHIHKIIYSLNKTQNIQYLKMIYKNRNDGTLHTLLDTVESNINNEKENEITFEDNEEIEEVFFYITKDNRLAAISIKTNMKVNDIGNTSSGEKAKDEKLEEAKNIIFGFGMHAGIKHGVSSMYSYYMDKKQYGIVLYTGLLQLRAKLKKNPDFKKEMEAKRASLSEKEKLILDTCDLPDPSFFAVASYIMSY
jgi:hypothetical protein